MKLIIEYGYGDESCCGTHTTAFDYSSKEELLLEIERMATEYIAKCECVHSDENELAKKFANKSISRDEYIAARKKYDIPNPLFKHEGYQLTISQFVDYNRDSNNAICYFYNPPAVYTVDEWFLYQQEQVYHD